MNKGKRPCESPEMAVFPGLMGDLTAARLFDEFERKTPWKQDEIFIAGRYVKIPRLQAWYGDPESNYSYSGIELTPIFWTPSLGEVRTVIEKVSGQQFNSVLLNYYRHGQDSMGWHSDDEAELGANPVIASYSLGGTRRFLLRKKSDKNQKVELLLESDSLLVMAASCQHSWSHSLPKTRKPVAPRINLTFRNILPSNT